MRRAIGIVWVLFWVPAVVAQEAGAEQVPPPPAAEPPRLLRSTELTLPPRVEVPASGIELQLTIGVDGTVSDPQLLESLGDEADAIVRAAALRLVFAPAMQDGEPVEARVGFRFEVTAVEQVQEPPPPPTAADTGSDPAATEQVGAPEEDFGDLVFGAQAEVDKPPPGAATQIKLRGAELTNIPGTFGEPLRVVATLPGVARTPFGLGFFLVRGASFQNTGFLVDGFPVPLLYHLGFGPAIISSRLVDRLDFYPGGYPVSYGRFSAGVIALNTAPPPADKFRFEFEVDLLRASALTVVPIGDGRGSIALALRRSYYDLILPLVTDDVNLFYTDYQVRLDYSISERVDMSLFVFGARDELSLSGETGQGSTTGSASGGLKYRFDRVIGSLRWRTTDDVTLKWSWTAGPSGVELGADSTGDASLSADADAMRVGQRVEAVISPERFWQTSFGVEQNAFLTKVVGSFPNFAVLPGIPAPERVGNESIPVEEEVGVLSLAPYLEQVVRPGPFEITGGIRTEYFRYADVERWEPEPRGVVRYALTDDVTFKAASGLFSQPPSPFQLSRTYGSPTLRPIRSWQSSSGVEIQLPYSLEIDTTGFYSDMSRLARGNSRPDVDEEGNPVRSFVADDGQGRAYGWELLLRRRVDEGLFGWLSYTLSRSERFLEGGGARPFAFDQTHVMNVASSYKTGDWRFGARFLLATGRPVNDLLGDGSGTDVVFDADEDEYRSEARGARIRLPTFHQLDVRVDYAWDWGPVDGSVFLDIINVYNASNAEGYQYNFDFSRRAESAGLPFLPTIGVSGVVE